MHKKDKKDLPSQLSLILRIAAGGYLVYLGWGLRVDAFAGDLFCLIGLIVFGLVGALLLIFSTIPLVRGEFLAPWQIAQMQREENEQETTDLDENKEEL